MARKNIDYFISETGCWICTSHSCDKDGYPICTIDGVWDRIHRHFFKLRVLNQCSEIPRGMVIRHTCDTRMCINPKHLMLGTHANNVYDRMSRKRSAIGSRSGRSKLTEDIVMKIRNIEGISKSALGRMFGVDRKTIRNILSGKIWRHVA